MNQRRTRVVSVQNEVEAPAARIGVWIEECDVELVVVHAYRGEPLPGVDEIDGVLVMPGSMGATDDAQNPWLPATRAWLSECVSVGLPVMGICLGAQLLAAACGGEVTLGAGPEFGVVWIELTDEGDVDPITGVMPHRLCVTEFHRDGISTLPPGAVVLASSALFPVQIFRLGTHTYGVQGHPEVDRELVNGWLELGDDDILGSSGRSIGEVIEEIHQAEGDFDRFWQPFFEAWAALVIDHASG
ncbi:MAG: type 1 glutamine amidotransferase [Actinobacteria bacterium]|uniref:Unannotated protein n=1 Tax=freshwater metagenome TaxID=449393 RepID=A0A6J7JTM9_9ZZZZ|nr:type 1 glutamine amidotransferase [Actinomycetota bacterium]